MHCHKPDQNAKAMTAITASRPPTREDASCPAELTVTGGTVPVVVGPTGVLVGVGVTEIGVVPDSIVVGGGVYVVVPVVMVVLGYMMVVFCTGGGT
jgi:hypothetical protein